MLSTYTEFGVNASPSTNSKNFAGFGIFIKDSDISAFFEALPVHLFRSESRLSVCLRSTNFEAIEEIKAISLNFDRYRDSLPKESLLKSSIRTAIIQEVFETDFFSVRQVFLMFQEILEEHFNSADKKYLSYAKNIVIPSEVNLIRANTVDIRADYQIFKQFAKFDKDLCLEVFEEFESILISRNIFEQNSLLFDRVQQYRSYFMSL